MSYEFTSKQDKLLKLADFLDSLPQEKFNLGSWCVPDHTCKTTACIGGWAVILFGTGKAYVSIAKEEQRLHQKQNQRNFIQRLLGIDYLDDIEQLSSIRKELYPDWLDEAIKILELSNEEKKIFFLISGLWRGSEVVTNCMAANALRYLAFHQVDNIILDMGMTDTRISERTWLDRPYDEESILEFIRGSPEMKQWSGENPYPIRVSGV